MSESHRILIASCVGVGLNADAVTLALGANEKGRDASVLHIATDFFGSGVTRRNVRCGTEDRKGGQNLAFRG